VVVDTVFFTLNSLLGIIQRYYFRLYQEVAVLMFGVWLD
jgi:hypothetical protein